MEEKTVTGPTLAHASNDERYRSLKFDILSGYEGTSDDEHSSKRPKKIHDIKATLEREEGLALLML